MAAEPTRYVETSREHVNVFTDAAPADGSSPGLDANKTYLIRNESLVRIYAEERTPTGAVGRGFQLEPKEGLRYKPNRDSPLYVWSASPGWLVIAVA